MRLRAAAVTALVALWSGWVFGRLLAGYFLADDFVPLVLFEHWREDGRLGAALAEKFWSGAEPGESRFYRPLTYLTFAASYLAGGTASAPWMAVNVVLHLANGALVAVIASLVAEGRLTARALAAGMAGASLFLFFAPAAEVVAWISGRYDALATFFTLLACASFLGSRRAGDGAWIVSLICAIAALLAKESAAIVPFAIVLLAWLRTDPARPLQGRALGALGLALPWLLVVAAYLAWRYFLFGSALSVYESRPLSVMVSAQYWREVAETFPGWLAMQLRSPALYAAAGALAVAQLGVTATGWPKGARERDGLLVTLAIAAITIALLLPQVGRLPPDGLGGRLLYQTAAFCGIFAGVALAHARFPRALWAVTAALVLVHALLQYAVLDRWLAAYRQMRELVVEVARVGAQVGAPGYALVIVPDSLDGVPFARNAQAGLMLPPVQREPLHTRLLVQADAELPLLAERISQNVVATVRRRSVFGYLRGERVAAPLEWPTAVLCWDGSARRLVALEVAAAESPPSWAQGVARAFAASSCARS